MARLDDRPTRSEVRSDRVEPSQQCDNHAELWDTLMWLSFTQFTGYRSYNRLVMLPSALYYMFSLALPCASANIIRLIHACWFLLANTNIIHEFDTTTHCPLVTSHQTLKVSW